MHRTTAIIWFSISLPVCYLKRKDGNLRFSCLLRGVRWFVSNVSGQRIVLIFRSQYVQEENVLLGFLFLDTLVLQGETETSVTNQPMPRNNPEA
jgi:hypothetical protein